jgi:hypothetical protein
MRELGEIVDELIARLARRETPLYDERANGDGDLHFRGAGDAFQSGQVAGSPTTGERDGDETGAGEEVRPAPSPMLSAGASAHASKGRKSRSPEAPAVSAVREVSPRGNGGGARHQATNP